MIERLLKFFKSEKNNSLSVEIIKLNKEVLPEKERKAWRKYKTNKRKT